MKLYIWYDDRVEHAASWTIAEEGFYDLGDVNIFGYYLTHEAPQEIVEAVVRDSFQIEENDILVFENPLKTKTMKLKKNISVLIRNSDKIFFWGAVERLTNLSVRRLVNTATTMSIRSRTSNSIRDLTCHNLQKNFKRKTNKHEKI